MSDCSNCKDCRSEVKGNRKLAELALKNPSSEDDMELVGRKALFQGKTVQILGASPYKIDSSGVDADILISYGTQKLWIDRNSLQGIFHDPKIDYSDKSPFFSFDEMDENDYEDDDE